MLLSTITAVQIVQCGWCGAINPRNRSKPSKDKSNGGAPEAKSAVSKIGRCLDKTEAWLEKVVCCEGSDSGTNWFKWACTLVVVFTSGLIGTIGVLGAYPVLYDLMPSPFWYAINATVTMVFEVNIMFNYYAAVLKPGGAVQQFYDLSAVPPPRNSFDNFTYCGKCVSITLKLCFKQHAKGQFMSLVLYADVTSRSHQIHTTVVHVERVL